MEKLIFVYNADSGKLKGLLGAVQKTFKPSDYSCKLCALTYGPLSEKKAWKNFRENLDMETEFFHKDEFEKAFASKFGYRYEYPIILLQTGKGLEIFMSREDLEETNSLKELIFEIEERL